jgi:hypothetical protein
MVIDAITSNHGNITAGAKMLGVTRQAMYQVIWAHPEIKEDIESARDKSIDAVENVMMELILEDKNPAMTMFFLKTRAGYKETVKNESTHEIISPIQIYIPDNDRD